MTFEVENKISDKDFAECFDAAVRHLQTLLAKCAEDAPDGGTKGMPHTWIKDMPTAPLLEHMSFMLGNQAFFVRLEDVESFDLPLLNSDDKRSGELSAALGTSRFPGTMQGLMRVANGYDGRACVMPMRRQSGGDGAFACAQRLKEIKLPKNLRSIGDGAFAGCLALKSVSLPKKLRSIARSQV